MKLYYFIAKENKAWCPNGQWAVYFKLNNKIMGRYYRTFQEARMRLKDFKAKYSRYDDADICLCDLCNDWRLSATMNGKSILNRFVKYIEGEWAT